MSEHTSHTRAADAYGQMTAAVDPRALEARILLKAAQKLEILSKRLADGENVNFRETGEVVEYNQKLWTVFLNDAMDPAHPLPQDIKNNIGSLAVFVFKRSKDVLIAPSAENIKILISINRNIAAGLMKGAGIPMPEKATDAASGKTKADSMI